MSIASQVLPNTICISGNVTLSLTGDPSTGASFQWQRSPASANTWTNITGATTSTYLVMGVTASTDYRCVISCGGVPIAASPSAVATVTVSTPTVLTTTPGSACEPGPISVALGATASGGATLKWYDVPSGGVSIGTGSPFNTPPISSTTTYYVAANEGGGSSNVGMPAALPTATSGAGTTNFGLVFDVLAPCVLQSVVLYAVATTPGTASTVTIDVIDASNTIIHTATVNVTGYRQVKRLQKLSF